jgi:hypothetical protein
VPLIREDQADIHVSLAGADGVLRDYALGSWSTYSGAGLEAQDSKTRPGNMGKQVTAGGPAERDDVEVTIQFNDIVAGLHPTFENMVGWARGKVALAFLGPNRADLHKGFSVVGILKSAVLPDMDSNGNEVSFYTMTFSLDEQGA